jgi:hypothetical protein
MEKYIIILILIVILYFLFFHNSCDTFETAANTTPGNLNSDLVDSINNLGQLAKDIQKPTGLTLPASLTVIGPINFLPKGCVIAWSGALAEIPYGWALCDGSNGRPDLTGRFIVGTGKPTGDISANPNNLLFGTNGGEQQHKLTIPEIPSHSHALGYGSYNTGPYLASLSNGIDNRNPVGNTGGDQYHNNMPPYYVLYWIIKTI